MPFYDPYSGIEIETEEERKRREELANTAVHTQEIKTYGDGTVEKVTKQEIPAGQTMAAQAPAIPQQPARPAPVSPDQAAYTAKMESGNNPNIGYHNPKLGTAYGTYGLTAPAYSDVQRANPQFAGRPITSLSPEEQTQAFNTYTGLNQQALQRFGVEPSEANTRLAHFLGAKGAADFLNNGTISPQAAAANGGEENVRRIAQQRLAGGNAPSSGAVNQQPQQPQPQAEPNPMYSLATGGQPGAMGGVGFKNPFSELAGKPTDNTTTYINNYQALQDDPQGLMKLGFDKNAPEWLQNRAKQRAGELLDQDTKQREAQAQLQNLTQNDMARLLTKKSEGNSVGDWLQYLLYKHVGLNDLANEKGEQLGIGHKWQTATVTGPNGEEQTVQVKTSASGKVLDGLDLQGNKLSPEQLSQAASGVGGGKVTTSGTFFQTADNQILRAQHDEQGKTRLVDAASGKRYTGSTKGLVKLEEAGALRKMDRGLVIDLAKKHGQNVLEAEKEYVDINGPFRTPEERQQFRQAYGYDLAQPAPVAGVAGYPGQQPATPPAQPAQPPAQAAQAPTAQAPVAPTVAAPQPQAAQAPVAPTAPVTQPLAGMQTGVAINKKQQEEFVRYGAEDITPKADAGGQVSRIRKEQIKGPDGILNNPEIAGVLQGGKGEVGNIIRDLVTGNFKDQADLSARVASLNLTDRQKDILYRQINLAAQVNPQTLKQNAGAGAVSDAEQKANKAANIDITRQPLYAGLADMSRSQFVNDLAVARGDFKASRPDLKTTEQFNTAWGQEKAKIQKQYDQVFEARAAYIAKYNKDGKNPGAVVDAFKLYPTPEWNSETRSWDLGTDYARKAARPKLNEFVK